MNAIRSCSAVDSEAKRSAQSSTVPAIATCLNSRPTLVATGSISCCPSVSIALVEPDACPVELVAAKASDWDAWASPIHQDSLVLAVYCKLAPECA